jgi:hypothetical protein
MRPSLPRTSGPFRAPHYRFTQGETHRLETARRMIRSVLLVVSLMALGVLGAIAQTGRNYNVPGMNFDLWCQEEAHLPAAQCDQRTPEDEKTFDDFRDKIDRYEIPYLQGRQSKLSIYRDIMHNDPVDNPLSQDPDAQTQDPNRQPPMSPP